jgi:fermentation-respiration switch protein FrsA (DUF1100 family)
MSRVRVLVVVLLVVVLLFAAGWLLQRRLVYFPDRAAPPPAAEVTAYGRDVTLRTADGLDLTAWLITPPPGTPDRRLAVLVAPGNAGNRLGRVPLAEALAGLGLTVLLVDYRGYGGNPGGPTERGLAADVDAARAFLVETAGFPAGRLVYYGESLGAAVATGLAARQPPAALILRSPFVDLPAAGAEHYPFLPVRLMARDRFPVAGPIARIAVPTLIVYGTADTVVPAAQSVTVAERAAGPVSVVAVEGAGHNDAALLHGPQLITGITDVLAGR